MPESVLVTGATGFIGSHLVDAMTARGDRVRALVRNPDRLRFLDPSKVELIEGGLDDSTDWDAALEGIDSVYHAAAVITTRSRKQYFWANNRGTEQVLAAAVKHRNRIRRFVYISSLAAVGPSHIEPVDEDTPPAPVSPYGESKLLGEEAVRAAGSLVPATIVRPPVVYGPRCRGLLQLFKSIVRGVFPVVGSSDGLISMIHVEDLVRGVLLASDSEAAADRTYFISDALPYPLSLIGELIARSTGSTPRTLRVPLPVALGAAVLAEAAALVSRTRPMITRHIVRDMAQPRWTCSSARAKQELGYESKVEFEPGIAATVEWYRSKGWM